MTYQKLIWINVPIEKKDGAGERYDKLFTGDLYAQLSAGPDETSGVMKAELDSVAEEWYVKVYLTNVRLGL